MAGLIGASLEELLHNEALGIQTAESLLRDAQGRSVPGAKNRPAHRERGELGELEEWLPGTVHEWYFEPEIQVGKAPWQPPLTLLASLAALVYAELSPQRRRIAWIGRSCWPNPQVLKATLGSIEPQWAASMLFLDPPGPAAESPWALEQCLQSPALGIVIGTAEGLSPATSRKLQLAAERGGTLGLLARPPWEAPQRSWAQSRWRVRSEPSPTMHPRWRMDRLGGASASTPSSTWFGQWIYEVGSGKGTLHLSTPVGAQGKWRKIA